MGIQSKILSFVGAMILLVVLLATLLISQRAQTLSKDLSLQVAEKTAQRYGLEVKRLLGGALDNAKLLETSFWQLRNAQVDRKVLDQILHENTSLNKNILGSWMLWEANAYDGKDNVYKETDGHDATGRVNSFWHWLDDDLVNEVNIDWQSSSWYKNPKKQLKETLENPYFYMVSGEEVLLISSVQPIVHNNKFYGVVGIDLKLEILRNLVKSLKVLDSGYSTLIANNGMYVAHPDQERIGKYINDFEPNPALQANINNPNGMSFETTFDASNVEILIEGDNLEISSFPNSLSQILSHIISNAIIHGFKSEKESIKTGVVKITLHHTQDHVNIVCSDNGIGMSKDMADKIFEAFSTQQLGAGGRGLGMNIVYNIVTRTLKGTIECESELDNGTLYRIQFPR